MAGSSTSFGVWALSLSACGGLLAAVSSDGRLEVRRQEAKPGGQAAAASCRLVSRGLVQLHEAPRPEAAAAGAESSARAVRVLLGEAAEAPPPPAPDGQAPTPPHLALRVVAFNPNPAHRQWVACAGPSGLLACVRVPSGEPSGKYFTIRATRDRYTRTPKCIAGCGSGGGRRSLGNPPTARQTRRKGSGGATEFVALYRPKNTALYPFRFRRKVAASAVRTSLRESSWREGSGP